MSTRLSRKQKEPHNYSVYMHTCLVNGKKYIGITKQKPERRWQNGYGYVGTYFWNAIHKYGWDNFTHEVLLWGLTEEEACQWEIALIDMHRTNNRKYGYNVSEGGETCDVCCGKYGAEHPNHKRVKMIDPATGKVLRIFGAQSEAARVMGINRKGITKSCLGITNTYKGYIWEYADVNFKKPEHHGAGNYAHTKQCRKIMLIEPDGETRKFKSIKEASEITGEARNSIWRHLNGHTVDTTGRRWCYLEAV